MSVCVCVCVCVCVEMCIYIVSYIDKVSIDIVRPLSQVHSGGVICE